MVYKDNTFDFSNFLWFEPIWGISFVEKDQKNFSPIIMFIYTKGGVGVGTLSFQARREAEMGARFQTAKHPRIFVLTKRTGLRYPPGGVD